MAANEPLFRESDGAPPAGRDVTSDFVGSPPESPAAPWTVGQLVARVKEALLDAFPAQVAVVGQVSNFKRHSSEHLYFSLKDEDAGIDAVMFRAAAAGVRFDIEDGLEVVAEGRVDVWEKAGRLQLYVQRLSPRGAGALELAFRQLKERLEREGLFDPARKKAIPPFPRAIGVITSPTGAAIRDIARTLSRRWPAARVCLVPVRVQGEQAPGEIAEALAALDAAAEGLGVDTIILARGGGSLEDLWAFNEEPVARAIFAAATPVISGVGHETDFTIADFVADLRAATPTAAAVAAVPDRVELGRHCDALSARLARRAGETLAGARAALAAVGRSVVFRDPASRVRSARQELDELAASMQHGLARLGRSREQRLAAAERALAGQHPRRRLERALAALAKAGRELAWVLGRRAKGASEAVAEQRMRLASVHPRHRLRLARQRAAGLARQLEAMSYRAVVRRGFSVTRIKGGDILRRIADAHPQSVLETEVADGKVKSTVIGPTPPAGGKPPVKGGPPGLFDSVEE